MSPVLSMPCGPDCGWYQYSAQCFTLCCPQWPVRLPYNVASRECVSAASHGVFVSHMPCRARCKTPRAASSTTFCSRGGMLVYIVCWGRLSCLTAFFVKSTREHHGYYFLKVLS